MEKIADESKTNQADTPQLTLTFENETTTFGHDHDEIGTWKEAYLHVRKERYRVAKRILKKEEDFIERKQEQFLKEKGFLLDSEFVSVEVTFGRGFSFRVPLQVKKGTSDEELKRLAYSIIRNNMPTQFDLDNMEKYRENGKLGLFISHE